MKKIALITGINGQDGALLANFLLKKNYIVHGIIRRSSNFNTQRLQNLYKDIHDKNVRLFLHYGDLSDSSNIVNILKRIKPDEIYNLGAQSHVKVSFEIPEYTININALGTLRILEAIKTLNLINKVKFYQASSSEMFGYSKPPQNENTVFLPASPYAISKLCAHWIAINYRKSYKIFASTGILFNHESSFRGDTFVTKKIVNAAIKIVKGNQKKLYLGNLYAKRDWGYAGDYVEGMWKILQFKKPDDFVLSTNTSCSVKKFTNIVFKKLGIEIVWRGIGLNEKGINKKTKKTIIEIDKKYFRPQEVENLVGDYSKAKRLLNWKPKTKLDALIEMMIKEQINL
jgi:GDPmannose 4,6-dehydratase